MARQTRNGGRTTPKGTRPRHLRPVEEPASDASPIDPIIDGGAADVLDKDDPVAAETWASGLLNLFESARRQAVLAGEDVPPFEDAVLERCARRRDRPGLVVAAALAAVLPPPLEERARRVVDGLRRSVAGPPWLDAIGRAVPTRCWVASDVFGDQDSLIVGFAEPGQPGEHAIVALVDRNLSGQAKDAWIASDVDEVVAAWRANGDPHMRVEEVPSHEALQRLRHAMAMSDLWNGDTELRTDEFAEYRAVVWARLRRAGHGEEKQDADEILHSEREAIVAKFLSSLPGRVLSSELAGADVELLARHLVDLRCDYEGRPLRWSPTVVGMLLTDLAPRKLLLQPDQAAALPAVLRAFVRFAAERSGLGAVFVDEILATIDENESEFLARISDPASAGPATALLAALRGRGVDLSDLRQVKAALEDLGPMRLPQPAPQGRKRPTAAAPADVMEAAEGALVLARFATLADFYGDGRKLTQTGQPTLADARALVSLLGTVDRFDETIGDRTFRTKSAAELPELGFTIRWAVAAGALRKEHGKLRATTAWRKLEDKPLRRWLKAADALVSLGPLAGFRAHGRLRAPDEFVDELLPEIFDALRRGAMPFEAVLDEICARADTMYQWLVPYMQDPAHRRTSFGWDLGLLVRILGWAGIADRVGATVEPDRWDPTRQRLAGGTVQLTELGRWWLGAEDAP